MEPPKRVGVLLWMAALVASAIFWLPMILTLLAGAVTGSLSRGASVRQGLIVGFWVGVPAWVATVVVFTLASYPPYGRGLWVDPAQPDYWGVAVVDLLFAAASAGITWALGWHRAAEQEKRDPIAP